MFFILYIYIIQPTKANKKIKERFKIRVYKSFTLPLNTSNKKYNNIYCYSCYTYNVLLLL